MALHGNLLSATVLSLVEGPVLSRAEGPDTLPAMGYLASVRDLKLDLDDLGTVVEDLRIMARRMSGDASGFIYEFEIRAGARAVLSGRLAAKLLATGTAA
jgi:predicted hotdog family 3-hydroxylacyl-ACP dehydratase